jgi:hypothetical protein
MSSTLKTNNLTHAVNDARRTIKLEGIWKDASKGDVKAINKKLKKGESPHVETDDRRTPLHYAAEFGHIAAADALLSAGARIDHKDTKGDTAIHVALKNKQEEMALFLAAKGADLYLSNNGSLSCFDLAHKISNRFVIKLREGSRCSNPVPTPAPAVVKPKPVETSFMHYPLLNQIILCFGEYCMLTRSQPSLGAPSPPERSPPFPKTPFHALQLSIGKLKGMSEQLILQNNANTEKLSPEFKGNCLNFKDNVSNLNNLLQQPIADAMTYNAIQDTLLLTSKLTDMFVQYEEGSVGMVFKAHMERFVMDIKKVGDAPLFPELVFDFVNLYRNVLAQLMFVRDPEKSKHISDGLQHCSLQLKELINAKNNDRPPQAHIRSIAESLTKINQSLNQSSHDAALFQEEEIEIFDSASQILQELEKIQLSPQEKRIIEIFLSEYLYIREAIAKPPPEPELLLNCALFISSTCARLAKALPQSAASPSPSPSRSTSTSTSPSIATPTLSPARKKWLDVGIGLLMQCHNELLLVACGILSKNRNYHFVHVGYVLRAISCGVAILLDPAYFI